MRPAGANLSAARREAQDGRVHIVQGEHYVTACPDVMVSTLLGSCVAACMRDPVLRIGGMNHFLLPGRGGESGTEGLRFGVHAMELLVNGLLVRGARRDRLEAKLFGGAHMLDALADVGRQNSDFALTFLKAEGIAHTGGSLGGDMARRVQFWPASGRARQMVARPGEELIFIQEMRRAPVLARDSGAAELF